MNPTNGKGDKNLHKRQQCSDEQMLSNWERAMKAPKTKCNCNGMPVKGGACGYNSCGDNTVCFAPNAYECEHKTK